MYIFGLRGTLEKEDILEIENSGEDIMDMELDDPIKQQAPRVEQERNDQAQDIDAEVTKVTSSVPEVGQIHEVTEVTSAVPEVGQILSDSPKQGSVSIVAEKAKKKKKWKSKNPAILKRRRQKRQEQRAQWRLRVRETLKNQTKWPRLWEKSQHPAPPCHLGRTR